jgi:hypothetical protein
MIKIHQRDDYQFPQPLYGMGQEIINKEGELSFVVGMQYTSDEWEYQLFYLHLEVLGAKWIPENELSTRIVEV